MSLLERLQGKRVGVALSSAFFGFYAHAGFLRALRAAGVEPTALSGSSAGALAAAFAGAGGLDELIRLITDLKRGDFWDPGAWTGRPAGLLKGRRFEALLRAHLPVASFEACPAQVVTVSTNLTSGRRHVDHSGPLVPAVWASCALPILFRPVARDGALHADGGILDKVPLIPLLDHAEVDVVVVHFIPSHGLSQRLPRGPWGFLDRSLDLSRDDGWRLQLELARARGVQVEVVTTDPPPRITPFTLSKGPAGIDEVERRTLAALRA